VVADNWRGTPEAMTERDIARKVTKFKNLPRDDQRKMRVRMVARAQAGDYVAREFLLALVGARRLTR